MFATGFCVLLDSTLNLWCYIRRIDQNMGFLCHRILTLQHLLYSNVGKSIQIFRPEIQKIQLRHTKTIHSAILSEGQNSVSPGGQPKLRPTLSYLPEVPLSACKSPHYKNRKTSVHLWVVMHQFFMLVQKIKLPSN